MPPFLWLALCLYLVVGAVSIIEADVKVDRAASPGAIRICLAALGFAASWPLRTMWLGLGRRL